MIAVLISGGLLADSILSWNSLLNASKPLNYWYVVFSGMCVFQFSICILARLYGKKSGNKCRRVIEALQFCGWLVIIGLLPLGMAWVASSWTLNELAIPLRLKIEFCTILTIFTLVMVPVVVISLYTVFRIVLFLSMIRNKAEMRIRLEELHQIMYSKNFNFSEVEKTLTSEFYQFPLKEFESDLLKREFSVECKANGEESHECAICYSALQQGDMVTKMPGCNDCFHTECLDLWIRTQYTCPTCRTVIRKNLLEHFHGTLALPKEGSKFKKPDQEIITEIIGNMSGNRFNMQKLKQAAESC